MASTNPLSVPAYAFEAYLTPPKTLTAIFNSSKASKSSYPGTLQPVYFAIV